MGVTYSVTDRSKHRVKDGSRSWQDIAQIWMGGRNAVAWMQRLAPHMGQRRKATIERILAESGERVPESTPCDVAV
jgi:hypothetical protein